LGRGHQPALYASRGGAARRLIRRLTHRDTNSSIDDVGAPFCPDANAPKDDSDPLDLAKKDLKDLDDVQRAARNTITVAKAFRKVAGVPTAKHPWPKWGEPLAEGCFPVNFEANVDDSVNPDFIGRVAAVAMQDFKTHAAKHAKLLNAPNVKLTEGVLEEFAKGSFRGFRNVYKAQFDVEKEQQAKKNASNSRKQSRRRTRYDNLISVVGEYRDTYGTDPTELLSVDFLSDDGSGPEDGAEETTLEWKRRMAVRAGLTGPAATDARLTKTKFFENIAPNWRSPALTQILRRLHELWWSKLTIKAVLGMGHYVRDTGRLTDKAPYSTPFDMGINRTWYETHKDLTGYAHWLKGWFTFGNPSGF
ncbi:hypothetical protein K466DRAFT_448709, partial [Polyporus arcularius HHB13444]